MHFKRKWYSSSTTFIWQYSHIRSWYSRFVNCPVSILSGRIPILNHAKTDLEFLEKLLYLTHLISSPWKAFTFLIIILFVYISNCWGCLNIYNITEHQDNFSPYLISIILSRSLFPSWLINLFQNSIISVILWILDWINPISQRLKYGNRETELLTQTV